jgi:hypothetical protein
LGWKAIIKAGIIFLGYTKTTEKWISPRAYPQTRIKRNTIRKIKKMTGANVGLNRARDKEAVKVIMRAGKKCPLIKDTRKINPDTRFAQLVQLAKTRKVDPFNQEMIGKEKINFYL